MSTIGNQLITSFNVVLVLHKNGTDFSGYRTFGTATATSSVAGSTFTLSSLDSNTRYTAILHVGDDTNPFVKTCFRTGYANTDMNYVENLGTSELGATRCFPLAVCASVAGTRRSGRVSAGRGTAMASGHGRARWSRAQTLRTTAPTGG